MRRLLILKVYDDRAFIAQDSFQTNRKCRIGLPLLRFESCFDIAACWGGGGLFQRVFFI